MAGYIVRRLGTAIITIFAISFLAFLFVALLPGNPAEILLGPWATPEAVKTLTAKWGLDQPLLVRYGVWLHNFLRGDFGFSLTSRKPVTELVLTALPVTAELCFLACLVGCMVGIPAGILAAGVRSRVVSQLVIAVAVLAQSIPSFVSALGLILLFSFKLKVLPLSGYAPLSAGIRLNLQHMCLPSLSLGLVLGGFLARYVRGCLLEVLQSDYIRTARAKGLSETVVLLKHAFRTSTIPVVSLLGAQIVWLLGGAIIQETVFVLPGMGRLVVHSVMNRDYAVVQATVLIMAVIAAVVNLLVDLLYGILDPRIRYE